MQGPEATPHASLVDSPMGSADGLLDEFWGRHAQPLVRREAITEFCAAALFIVACIVAAFTLDPGREWPVLLAIVLTGAYALAGRVEFHVGAGLTVPTQLVLVPMLLLLPETAVPALVATGLVLSSLPDVLARTRPPDRLVVAIGDAWHTVGPMVVISLFAPGPPSLSHWPIYLAAFFAQCVVDVVVSTLREWFGTGIAPSDQFHTMATVMVTDALLLPTGLAAALATIEGGNPAALLVVPLVVLLMILAKDRHARVQQAQDRLAELRQERARVQDGVRRFGEALSANFDREALLELITRTAVDAVGAETGHIVQASDGLEVSGHGAVADRVDHHEQLSAVEATAAKTGLAMVDGDGRAAMASHLGASGATSIDLIVSVARNGAPFENDEREALQELAAQAAVSLENLELHEKLRLQAVTDALTGLANHRRFQEILSREVERARRSSTPIGVVLLDVDNFKKVNDTHGHLVGDEVLRHVAGALSEASRATDELARYGGEEFAVVVPGADRELLGVIAERLRCAVAARPAIIGSHAPLPVTVSAGAATFTGDAAYPVALVAAADEALYAAKDAGKNQVVVAAESPPLLTP